MKIFSGHNRRKLVAAVVAIAVAGFYFLVNPLSAKWVPQCMFLRMTGLECPGCGAQRMAHALLHGDLRSAWEYNSFLLLILPLLAFMAWLETRRKRLPKLYAGFYSLPVIVGIAASVVAWFIVRNFNI